MNFRNHFKIVFSKLVIKKKYQYVIAVSEYIAYRKYSPELNFSIWSKASHLKYTYIYAVLQ